MFKDIISLPETNYLGFGVMMPWENNLEIQFNLWEEAFTSGKAARLKEICGSEKVIGIFCYRCDMEAQTFSYHVACENKLNAVSSEFEELKMKALTYARFESECPDYEQRFAVYNALCDEIWGQWLPNSNYVSLIELETLGCVEGYASLEIHTPENPADVPYKMELLLPVKVNSVAEFFYNNPNAPKPNKPNLIGTTMLIEYDDKLLLEHRVDSERWAIIGGSLQNDESFIECAIRETKEETGLELTADNFELYRIYDNPSIIISYPDGNIFRSIMVVYKVILKEAPTLTCSEESKELRFFSKSELKDVKIVETHTPILEDYLRE